MQFSYRKHCTIANIFILFIFIVLAYWNSTSGKWYFDDYPNIVYNTKLHIDDLSQSSIASAVTADPTKPKSSNQLYRPTALLTFAFNYLLSGTQPFSYHIVNIATHIATSIFLYLTTFILLQSPKASTNTREHAEKIALATTLLWCLSPIQTQAVTYIVQRMTSLAGLFSALSLYIYCRMRLKYPDTIKTGYAISILLCFILGIGSKEIAILIPINIFLIEIFFFREIRLTRKNISIALIGAIFIYLIAALVTQKINLFSFFSSSDTRPFTSYERLITEFRVLTYYLFQIFTSNTNNLSLLHDIQISSSLLNPPATLFSLAFLATLLSTAFLYAKKYPIYSFVVFFFFLNHTIESTVIPLELAFEHRNYIPTFFIFFPISSLLISISFDKSKKTLTRSISALFLVTYILFSLINTIQRNREWTDPFAFWHKEARLNQHSPRAAAELGNLYLQQNNSKLAIDLFNLGLSQNARMQNRATTQATLLNGLGLAYFQQQNFETALVKFNECLDTNPHDIICWRNSALTLIQVKNYEQAHHNINILINHDPKSPIYNLIKGVIYLHQNAPEAALKNLENAYILAPEDLEVTLHYAHILARTGSLKRALTILENTPPQLIQNNKLLILKSYLYHSNNDIVNSKIYWDLLLNLQPNLTFDEIVLLNTTNYGIDLVDKITLKNFINERAL